MAPATPDMAGGTDVMMVMFVPRKEAIAAPEPIIWVSVPNTSQWHVTDKAGEIPSPVLVVVDFTVRVDEQEVGGRSDQHTKGDRQSR